MTRLNALWCRGARWLIVVGLVWNAAACNDGRLPGGSDRAPASSEEWTRALAADDRSSDVLFIRSRGLQTCYLFVRSGQPERGDNSYAICVAPPTVDEGPGVLYLSQSVEGNYPPPSAPAYPIYGLASPQIATMLTLIFSDGSSSTGRVFEDGSFLVMNPENKVVREVLLNDDAGRERRCALQGEPTFAPACLSAPRRDLKDRK